MGLIEESQVAGETGARFLATAEAVLGLSWLHALLHSAGAVLDIIDALGALEAVREYTGVPAGGNSWVPAPSLAV